MNAINEHQEHVPCLNDEEAVPFFKSYVKRLGDEIAHLEHLALTDLDKEMKFQIHKMKGGASIYGLDKFRDSLLKLSESKSVLERRQTTSSLKEQYRLIRLGVLEPL